MAKKSLEINNDVVVIKMEMVDQLPTFKLDRNGKYIKWGKDNKFPKKLINCYENHPENSAIIKGKARYLAGTKIIPSVDSPLISAFMKKANQYEDWYCLSKKLKSDKTLYGGWACQVNSNLLGQPVEWYHLDMGKLRFKSDLTGMWYSEDWNKNVFEIKKTFFPFWKPGYVGASVFLSRDFTPSITELDGLYPSPDYASVLLDIETDIEISNFFHSLVKNGFSAGHIITFFNGKMTPEAKAEIEKRFKERHQGTDNAGRVVLAFTDPGGKGAEITNITPTGLADQYEVLNKRNQQKIITGHNVPGVLFKIKADGSQLGNDRNEIDLAHDLFINEYAKVEQVDFNEFMHKMCLLKTGVDCCFEIEQVQPIGRELPLDNQNIINALNARDPNIVTNYIIEKYGLKLPVAEISDVAPAVTRVKENANDSLKSLTGRQRGALDTIARKFNKGILTEQQAIMQLLPFGFTSDDAKLYLGIEANTLKIQQSKQDEFFEWVKLNTIEIDEADEILNKTVYNFKLDDDFKKEDGNIVPKKGFIEGLIDSFKNKFLKSDFDTEVYTVYKYGLRPELEGEPVLLDTSHEFCIKMVAATSGNKRLTYEAIDKMHNDSDGDNTNAWDFRGGFWGKKNSCRHVWVGETRIKKIAK